METGPLTDVVEVVVVCTDEVVLVEVLLVDDVLVEEILVEEVLVGWTVVVVVLVEVEGIADVVEEVVKTVPALAILTAC